jgi:UDP-N-acetylglucosamine 2-epimerase
VQTADMLRGIEEVLLREKPDWLLVYGDTNSTIAGALAAAKLHVPVAHVEAGLRSFNRRMPEEINRVLTDHVSALLFCPTTTAVDNLAKEGITAGVHLVGDVMQDALLYNKEIAQQRSRVLDTLGLRSSGVADLKRYYLATVHRAENTDDTSRLREIVEAFVEIGQKSAVVWPVHPRTKKILKESYPALARTKGVHLIDPVSYLDMLALEKNACAILTDSGGVQKEAYWMRVPCITLRDETEWVETLEGNWNTLVGANRARIVEAVEKSAPSTRGFVKTSTARDAATQIVDCMRSHENGKRQVVA